MILRLYGPLEPWFNKTWRPGEIELLRDDDLQKVEMRLDKREECRTRAEAKKLDVAARIEFVRDCMK